MRENWIALDFEECLQKTGSVKKIPKKKFLQEGLYPVISQEDDFINGYWNEEKEVFKVIKPVVVFGDHTKKIKYVPFDFVCGADGVKIFLPIKELNSKFFAYQLTNFELRELGYARHYRLLKEKKILVPPLPEQEQIVLLLDKALAVIDQAKANIEKNVENAKELFQSKLNEIFSQKGEGWEERKLGKLGTLTSSKRIFKKEYVDEGIPFYRSKEVKELAHGKEISLELFITENRYTEIKEKFGIPSKGDILLTAVGTIGEMYIVGEDEKFYFKDGNIMWLKDFNDLIPEYLKYALTFYVEKLKEMSQGSAYSALTIEKLKAYSIPVPSIQEQIRIVEELNTLKFNINRLSRIFVKKNDAVEDLKKSLLQKAFSGELTQKNIDINKVVV